MIPRRIVLHNFRAIAEADINLADVSVAAIIGPNGAGKSSTFTLAPVFALFGDKIKGIAMDDLVRRGAQEMAVCFEFEHNGSVYQVIRTRSIKGNGKSTLELQQLLDGRWVSRSAEKIKDTEKVIVDLINLDVETFTASSMILQGRSNEFTAQPAGRRKEILQQILGLSIYEQLQAKARQRAAELNVRIETYKAKIAELEERLKRLDEKRSALSDTQVWLAENAEVIKATEVQLRQQEDVIRAGEAKQAKAAELQQQVTTLNDEITALILEQSDLLAKIQRAEKILSHEAEILTKSAELELLRDEITALTAREPELTRLSQRIQQIDSNIQQGASRVQELQTRVQPLTKLLANRELLAGKVEEHRIAADELEQMDQTAERWQELERELVPLRAELDAKRVRIESMEQSLQAEIKTLQAKTGMLAESNCIDTSIAACHFLSDAQQASALLLVRQEELEQLDRNQLTDLEDRISKAIDNQTGLGYDRAKHQLLKSRVESLRILSDQFTQMDAKQELLDTLQGQILELEQSSAAYQAAKDAIEAEYAALAAELEPLPTKHEHAAKLQQWAVLKDQLAANRQLIEATKPRLEAVETEISGKQEKAALHHIEIAEGAMEALDHEKHVQELQAIKRAYQEQRDQQNRLHASIGRLEGEIQALEQDQAACRKIAGELQPLTDEWSRYQVLIRAYGRDGIPALIIENAVPELERIANDILSQMSKGKHYVRFETQKELKSRDGVAETLDIIVGDWTSERPYETFSGGEQLRIDYAIRFALAELLARRAGSRVEWLTIDEGLGSQDAEHRVLVLEAIKSVADRFKKVLVITHIEDAQAVFDQHISLENFGVKVKVLVT